MPFLHIDFNPLNLFTHLYLAAQTLRPWGQRESCNQGPLQLTKSPFCRPCFIYPYFLLNYFSLVLLVVIFSSTIFRQLFFPQLLFPQLLYPQF